MPTRRGRALMFGAIGLYFVARALSVDELFSVAIAAGVLPGLSSLAVRWARYRIGFSRAITPRRLFPGGRLAIQFSVRNLGSLLSPPLLLEDQAPPALGGPGRFSLASLPPGRRETVVVERHPTTRGRYSVGPLHARVVDPFGLAEATATLAVAEDVLVYPRIEPLGRSGPPADRAGKGPSAVYRLAPAGDEFYAVREYESGDDLRKIHWSSVARTGQLMIRQDEARFYPRATVFLDARKLAHRGFGAEASVEWAVSATASTLWHLGRLGFGMRLATDEREPTGSRSGKSGIESLLEILAVLEPSGVRSLQPGLRRTGRRPGAEGALIAILPPPSAEDLAALARLRGVYRWCGAVILDVDSFGEIAPRTRAEADQKLAAAEGSLIRAGWRVRSAGARDRYRDVWQNLIVATGYLRSSA
ncbi:MAG: DUF58 domain-containing protein, partial [Actinomycetota bacterium]